MNDCVSHCVDNKDILFIMSYLTFHSSVSQSPD
jgi:hypothetical protein